MNASEKAIWSRAGLAIISIVLLLNFATVTPIVLAILIIAIPFILMFSAICCDMENERNGKNGRFDEVRRIEKINQDAVEIQASPVCHPAMHDWGILGYSMFNSTPRCKICGTKAGNIG